MVGFGHVEGNLQHRRGVGGEHGTAVAAHARDTRQGGDFFVHPRRQRRIEAVGSNRRRRHKHVGPNGGGQPINHRQPETGHHQPYRNRHRHRNHQGSHSHGGATQRRHHVTHRHTRNQAKQAHRQRANQRHHGHGGDRGDHGRPQCQRQQTDIARQNKRNLPHHHPAKQHQHQPQPAQNRH